MDRKSLTAFCGVRRIAAGDSPKLWQEVRAWVREHGEAGLLFFDDDTGKQVDFDFREELPAPRVGPGRPKLGVVSREVSLLPRHWEWLEGQPQGASAAMRRLVDEARSLPEERKRQARDAARHFLAAMAGDYPGNEEATRALNAGDLERMGAVMREWPIDVRMHAERLARGEN